MHYCVHSVCHLSTQKAYIMGLIIRISEYYLLPIWDLGCGRPLWQIGTSNTHFLLTQYNLAMKARLFLILVLSCLMTSKVLANDTIITKNAERLIVKITEVSSQEIKYKELDNLDGPVFVLNTAEISSILFNNGATRTFNTATNSTANICGATKIRNNLLVVNGESMTRNQFEKYLHDNDQDAYRMLNQGNRTYNAGCALLGVGLVCDFFGFLVGTTASNTNLATCGYICASIGGLMEIACIPTLIVGSSKIRQSAEIYTRNCERKQNYAVTLTPGITSNGFGFVLRF